MLTVGLLYPGHSAEDDFPALEARLDGAVRLPVVITSVGEDAHRVDALLDLGSGRRLAEGAAQLAAEQPDAVMWACTSGSFVFGPEGARAQASAVARPLGVPASSTSIAFVDALRAPRFPAGRGRGVIPGRCRAALRRLPDARAASRWSRWAATGSTPRPRSARSTRRRWSRWSPAADHPDAEAVLVPDTAMHTLAIVDKLEAAVGKPVLTANQVTVWKGLRTARPGADASGARHAVRRRADEQLHRAARPGVDAQHHRRQAAAGHRPRRAQAGSAARRGRVGSQARVSRGPLREGMQRLTQEGLLVVDPQPRAVRHRHDPRRRPRHVRRPGGDRARRRPQDPRRRPRRRRQGAAADRRPDGRRPETPADVSELDIAFHERLVQLARSPRLSRMHQTFITETRMCIHALDETYATSEVRDKEHRAVGQCDPQPATASSPTGC